MKLLTRALGVAALALSATTAMAQIPTTPTVQPQRDPLQFARDRNIGVNQRALPDYEALGARIGGFRLDATALVSAGYVDNVFATSVNQESDSIFHFAPSLNLSSVWSRHALGAYVNTDFIRLGSNSSENADNWTVGTLGRLDFAGQLNLGGNLSYGEQVEPRASSSSPNRISKPVKYSVGQGQMTLNKQFNRLRISGLAGFRDFDFQDGFDVTGVRVDQDFRDQTQITLSARADYGLSPDTAVFVQVVNDDRNYDQKPPLSSFNRDSNVTSLVGGANFELTTLVRGEIGLGYQWITHTDPILQDTGGFNARAQVEYFVTSLATITVSGSRAFQDSGIPQASGYVSSAVNARVDYELRPNIILGARAGYERNKFLEITRRDRRTSFGLNANYLLNRRISLNLAYDHLRERSTGLFSRSPFRLNTLTAGVTLRY